MRIKKTVDLTLIISLFQSEESVDALFQELQTGLSSFEGRYEIVFVDDGSTDNTFDKLQKIVSEHKQVAAIRMRAQFGESAAFDAAMAQSTGEKVLFVSERVRVNPGQFVDLVCALDSGTDFVVGHRYPRKDARINRVVSGLFNWLVNRMSHLKLRDINSGVFASYRRVLEKLPAYGDLFYFLPVLAAQQGYSVSEVDIKQLPGRFRVSRYLNDYIRRLLDMVTVFFLTRYSKKPIHFMGFVGTVFFLIGLAIEIYLFIYRILMLGPIAGRPLLILGALLLVIGIQMISIGLLGEMIIFTHAGEIEEYNVEEVAGGAGE